jgi:hypothetical protein
VYIQRFIRKTWREEWIYLAHDMVPLAGSSERLPAYQNIVFRGVTSEHPDVTQGLRFSWRWVSEVVTLCSLVVTNILVEFGGPTFKFKTVRCHILRLRFQREISKWILCGEYGSDPVQTRTVTNVSEHPAASAFRVD